jgi:hypothetical protein
MIREGDGKGIIICPKNLEKVTKKLQHLFYPFDIGNIIPWVVPEKFDF